MTANFYHITDVPAYEGHMPMADMLLSNQSSQVNFSESKVPDYEGHKPIVAKKLSESFREKKFNKKFKTSQETTG